MSDQRVGGAGVRLRSIQNHQPPFFPSQLQIQAWGASSAKLLSTGLALAALDDRVVVKVPATRAGLEAAARLKDAGARVTLTAVYEPAQALVGAAVGCEYVAPYLGRITDGGEKMGGAGGPFFFVSVSLNPPFSPLFFPGRDGLAEVASMQAALESVGSATRLLVASIRSARDVVSLAAAGVTTFTLSPDVAAALVASSDTDAAASAFEDAAAQLGAE